MTNLKEITFTCTPKQLNSIRVEGYVMTRAVRELENGYVICEGQVTNPYQFMNRLNKIQNEL